MDGNNSIADNEVSTIIPLSPLSSDSEIINNVYDVCRLCLTKVNSSTKTLQVSDRYPTGSNMVVSSMIEDSLSIEMRDEVSRVLTKVCEDCVTDLFAFTNYRTRCKAVDGHLRQIILRNKKIAEAQALYGPLFLDIDSVSEEHVSAEPSSIPCESPQNESLTTAVEPTTSLSLIESNKGLESSIIFHQSEPVHTTMALAESTEDSNTLVGLKSNIDTVCHSLQLIGEKGDINTELSIAGKTDMDIDLKSKSTPAKSEPKINSKCGRSKVVLNARGRKVNSEMLPNAESTAEVMYEVAKSASSDVENSSCSNLRSKHSRHSIRTTTPLPEVLLVVNKEKEKQLVFRCKQCGLAFANRLLHRRHIASHTNRRGFLCQYCDKWFPVRSGVVRHERIHSGEKPFTCILCNRSFSQKEILQRHVLTHEDSKPFQCPHCDKGYTQKEALKIHVKSTHRNFSEIMQYPCVLCDKAFCHPSGLSRHMQSHTGKRFSCAFCNQHFSDASSLRRHQKKRHGSVDDNSKNSESILPDDQVSNYYQLLHSGL